MNESENVFSTPATATSATSATRNSLGQFMACYYLQ